MLPYNARQHHDFVSIYQSLDIDIVLQRLHHFLCDMISTYKGLDFCHYHHKLLISHGHKTHEVKTYSFGAHHHISLRLYTQEKPAETKELLDNLIQDCLPALHNCLKHFETMQQAQLCPLTLLKNKRCFLADFKQQVVKAQRHHYPLHLGASIHLDRPCKTRTQGNPCSF